MGKHFVVAFFVSAAMGCFACCGTVLASLTYEEERFMSHLNQARVQKGLHQLSVSDHLVESSRSWSSTMQRQGRLYHSGASDRAENVATGCADGYAAFRMWMNSPPHHSIMMSSRYTTVGVGQSGGYWTLQAKSEQTAVPSQIPQQQVIMRGQAPQMQYRIVYPGQRRR